jgi:uncharacterized protein (TIGR00369 family)
VPKLDAGQLQEFLAREGLDGDGTMIIEDVGPLTARLRLKAVSRNLRPGGTLSGVSMMALSDVAIYVALLGEIGLVPLAVTTSLMINFLRKPPLRDILAEARLLKVGKALAVGEIHIYSEGDTRPVAHCMCTYSIPPRAPSP